MSFTYQVENDEKLPLLDILVTNVYHKPTFSGLYTNFHFFLPATYKTGLLLCSDWLKIHTKIIINIITKNNFPCKLIDHCMFSSKKEDGSHSTLEGN